MACSDLAVFNLKCPLTATLVTILRTLWSTAVVFQLHFPGDYISMTIIITGISLLEVKKTDSTRSIDSSLANRPCIPHAMLPEFGRI